VQRILSHLIEERGAPHYLRSDNGPEFICRTLRIWLLTQGSQSYFIKPGSLWQNGHAESFMSRLRAECLDAEVFFNLNDSQLKLGIYRRYYNHERPHSALNYLSPAAFAAQATKNMTVESNL
jgi:transposase InsO family protein